MCRVVLLAVLAACESEQGEPISGDVAFTIDGAIILPTAGAAIRDTDPTKQLVILGTRDISCQTTLGSPLRKGTYATMLIDRAIGAQAAAQISVIRVSSSATQINGQPSTVMIDELGDRVTGSLTFEITDETGAAPLTLGISGAFDVVNCSP